MEDVFEGAAAAASASNTTALVLLVNAPPLTTGIDEQPVLLSISGTSDPEKDA